MGSRKSPRSRKRTPRPAPGTAAVVRGLSDADLKRLLDEARALAGRSDPSFESLEHYGVRDASALELWLRRLEAETERRKKSPPRSAAEIAPPVGR